MRNKKQLADVSVVYALVSCTQTVMYVCRPKGLNCVAIENAVK